MNLEASIVVSAGGPGSGCRGSNCGRPFGEQAYQLVKKQKIYQNSCADTQSGCKKMERLYKQLGMDPATAKTLRHHFVRWAIGVDPKPEFYKAVEEMMSGDPKSDLAKALAVENAIVRNNYGKRTLTLHRGIDNQFGGDKLEPYMKRALAEIKSGKPLTINPASSWARSSWSAHQFGSYVLKAKVPTSHIIATDVTNPMLSNIVENEYVVASPGGKMSFPVSVKKYKERDDA